MSNVYQGGGGISQGGAPSYSPLAPTPLQAATPPVIYPPYGYVVFNLEICVNNNNCKVLAVTLSFYDMVHETLCNIWQACGGVLNYLPIKTCYPLCKCKVVIGILLF